MYYAKFFDRYNCEIYSWRRESKDIKDLEPRCIILTKHHPGHWAIIEDENFDRFGWYKDGKKQE